MRTGLDHYYALLREGYPWLAEAMCWTVVEPVTAPVDAAEVVRRLGGNPRHLRRRRIDDFDDVDVGDQCLFFVGETSRAVMLLEVNNYQGTRPEVLRWLSDGARVHSAFWNVNGANSLNYAVYGQLITTLAADFPDQRYGTRPDALDADLGDVLQVAAGAEEYPGRWGHWAAMLATVDRRTGVRLDDAWLDTPQRSIVAPALRADPHGPAGGTEPDLDATFRLAPEPAQRSALVWLVELLVERFALGDEPAWRAGVDALRAAQRLDKDQQTALFEARDRVAGRDEVRSPSAEDPAWRRMQASMAVANVLSGASRRGPAGALDALGHASLALADEWSAVRAGLRSRLVQTQPQT